MRKFLILVFTSIILFVFVSCSNMTTKNDASNLTSDKTISSSPSSSSNTLNKVVKNIYLREGATNKGSVIISSQDVVDFYTKHDKAKDSYQIVFELTDNGKKSLSEQTTKLSQSAGSVSLWIENEMIVNLNVYAPITDGTFAITESDADSANKLSDKLQDKSN